MKEFWQNLKGWQKGGIFVALIAVIAIIIVAVVVAINSEPNVKINFSEDVSIPGGEIRKIREKLVNVISNNTENFSRSVTYVGNARDYEEDKGDKYSTATFIVDFDTISESYAVSVTWPASDDDSPNIIIACPLMDSKYPETPCKTEYNDSSDITGYLPYEGTLPSGAKFKINEDYDNGKLYLNIKTNGDANEAVAAAKKWVSSIHLNPDDYTYFVAGKQYIQANNAKTKDENVNKNLPYYMPGVYNVYPVTDEGGNVTSIKAELAGCTDAQTDPVEEDINSYLSSKGISYPVSFEYCAE